MKSIRYVQVGKRDIRLDFLRGYALFSIAINHIGIDSYWKIITRGSVFLLTSAEIFFFISGMTLGIISVGKPLTQSVERLLKRTWVVYLSAIGVAFSFGTLNVLTEMYYWGDIDIASVSDLIEWFVGVLFMKVDYHGSNILVNYVFYLGTSSLALWGFYRKRPWTVVGAIGGVYFLSQLDPNMTNFSFSSFRHIVANSPVFFGGLIVGYYRKSISEKLDAWQISKSLDWLVIFVGIIFYYLWRTKFDGMPYFKDSLLGLEFRERFMPPLNLFLVFVYMRIFWLATTYLWFYLYKFTGWFFIELGQASLFTYIIHLCLLPIFWNLPYFDGISVNMMTVWGFAVVLVLYLAVQTRLWVLNKIKTNQVLAEAWHKNLPIVLSSASMVIFLGITTWQVLPEEVKSSGDLAYVFIKIWRYISFVILIK